MRKRERKLGNLCYKQYSLTKMKIDQRTKGPISTLLEFVVTDEVIGHKLEAWKGESRAKEYRCYKAMDWNE
jgi:hypothetical protein